MSEINRTRNEALLRFILLPVIFLTVALFGGLRIGAEDGRFIFIAPPLMTLVFALLMFVVFIRGSLLKIETWFSHDYPTLTNVSHVLTLATLFFATAQAFNSVLPESGFFFWLFALFFFWALLMNLISIFDARRFLISLIALFGVAFILKYVVIASLNAPQESVWRKLAGIIFEGITLGSFNAPAYANSTGYISFFALMFYLLGLFLLPAAPITKNENTGLIKRTNEPLIVDESVEAIAIEDDDEMTEVTKNYRE